MQLTCPCCLTRFPIAAGFADDDGKRLAAQLADMEPVLARATIGYLRLFKPAKQQLRAVRAAHIVKELRALVDVGRVSRDERTNIWRPATPALWAEGIEQMLAEAGNLTLPITAHNYLRVVVFGLADKADAARERQREADLKAGRHLAGNGSSAKATNPAAPSRRSMLRERLRRIETDRDLGILDDAVAATKKAEAMREFGVGND